MSLLAGLEQLTPALSACVVSRHAGAGARHRVPEYSLLPWLSVFTISPSRCARSSRKWAALSADYIQHYIDLVSLSGSEWKKPSELSGMRQRLSLAWTFHAARVPLLDEPLSALTP